MSAVLKITSTRVNPLTLYYRVPGGSANVKQPFVAVQIPARALNHAVGFANEAHLDAFVAQNQRFADRGIILFGSTKESTAEKTNEKNANAEAKQKAEAIAAVTEKTEASATKTAKKSKLKVSVEKVEQ